MYKSLQFSKSKGNSKYKPRPMKLLSAVILIVVLHSAESLGTQLPAAANQQQPPAGNAAVKYLRADAALRQSYALAPDAAAKLEKALESPLDADDEKLAAAAGEALVEFHHGASLKECDWALSAEDGPFANTSHRGAIRELVAVAGLRARLRFRDGDSDEAISDALAALAAARHLSVDGTLASVLFAYKLEKAIIGVLAQNLTRLSPVQLKNLANGLDSLPAGSSLPKAFVSEKVDRDDLSRIIERAKTRDELIERLVKGVPRLQSNKELAVDIVDGCGGSVEGFLSCVGQQNDFYRSWATRFSLPPEQFEKEYQSQIEDLSKKNPVIRVMTPSLPRFRWAEAYARTRRVLLEASIAVRLDGPSALNRHLDPYDGKTFTYVPVHGVFRLESQLRDNGIQLSLSTAPAP
jgi:hypothetical protein